MTEVLHPAASRHLPPFITAPGEIDLFWVAALLFALIDFPDFAGPLSKIARSLEAMAGIKHNAGAAETAGAEDRCGGQNRAAGSIVPPP